MAKIRAIIKRTDEKYGHMTNLSPSLENLQKHVGGYIQTVVLDSHKGLVILCNEDGKLLNLPRNFKIPGDVIVGDVIICGIANDGFTNIPIEFAEWKFRLDKMKLLSY